MEMTFSTREGFVGYRLMKKYYRTADPTELAGRG